LTDSGPPSESLPDRRPFWQWVGQEVRPYVGWTLIALGVLALFLGWYGVSGQSLTSKQLPYLVSGGLTGIGLIVVAAVFLITDDFRRQVGRLHSLQAKVDDLYSLLIVDPPPDAPPDADADADAAIAAIPAAAASGVRPATAVQSSERVALANGSSFHRPDCTLVADKTNVGAVDKAAIKARTLSACRLCDPAPPGRPAASASPAKSR
jgi:hypothetical protein